MFHCLKVRRLRQSRDGSIPSAVVQPLQGMAATLRALRAEVVKPVGAIGADAKRDTDAKRLMPIPGVGPIIAFVILAIARPRGSLRERTPFRSVVGISAEQAFPRG